MISNIYFFRFERPRDTDVRRSRDRPGDRDRHSGNRPTGRPSTSEGRPGQQSRPTGPTRSGPSAERSSRRDDTSRASGDRKRDSDRGDRPRGQTSRGDREDSRREWKSERAHLQSDRRGGRSGPGSSRTNSDSRYDSRNQSQFGDNRNKNYGSGMGGGGGPMMGGGPAGGRDQFANTSGPGPQGGRWPDRGPAPMPVSQPQMIGPPAGNLYIPQSGPPGIVPAMGGFMGNVAPIFSDGRGRGADIYDAYKSLNTSRRF